jgi:adenylate kinase
MAPTVVVTGVPGVGASRVCEAARRRLGDEYTLVNFGDVMLEEALEHGLAEGRETLTELPIRDQRLLQRRAAELIARKPVEGALLVNTHLVVHTTHGFIPGLPDGVRSEVDPSTIAVVDASPETIRRRRETSERTYPGEAGTTLAFHRQLQNAAALHHAAAADAPVEHVPNDDDLEAAAERLATVAERTRDRLRG